MKKFLKDINGKNLEPGFDSIYHKADDKNPLYFYQDNGFYGFAYVDNGNVKLLENNKYRDYLYSSSYGGYYLLGNNGFYTFLKNDYGNISYLFQNKKVEPFEYSSAYKILDNDKYRILYVDVHLGLGSLKEDLEKTIIKISDESYDEINFLNVSDIFGVRKGKKWGFVKYEKGNFINMTNIEFDEIGSWDGYFIVKKDNVELLLRMSEDDTFLFNVLDKPFINLKYYTSLGYGQHIYTGFDINSGEDTKIYLQNKGNNNIEVVYKK